MDQMFYCSECNPEGYAGKTVLVFENEGGERRYRISTFPSAGGRTFAMNLVAIDCSCAKIGTVEHQIAIAERPVDQEMLSMLKKPGSKFLNGRCDFVLFINSPRRKIQFTEPKNDAVAV